MQEKLAKVSSWLSTRPDCIYSKQGTWHANFSAAVRMTSKFICSRLEFSAPRCVD